MNINKKFYLSARNLYFSEVDFMKMTASEFDEVYASMNAMEQMSYDAWAFQGSGLPSRYSSLLPKEIREHNARCVKARLDYFGI